MQRWISKVGMTCVLSWSVALSCEPKTRPTIAPSPPAASGQSTAPKGAAASEPTCQNGDACFKCYGAYEEGRRVPRDPDKAVRCLEAARGLLDQECARGARESCFGLGYILTKGYGGVRDVAKARSLFHRSCELNSAWGCAEMAELLLADYRTAMVNAFARDPNVNGCFGSDVNENLIYLPSDSCLAMAKAAPPEVPTELLRQSAGYLEKACELEDHQSSCRISAQISADSHFTKPDPQQALKYLLLGCQGDRVSTCVTIARFLDHYERGDDAPVEYELNVDKASMIEMARRVCADDKNSCDALKRLDPSAR